MQLAACLANIISQPVPEIIVNERIDLLIIVRLVNNNIKTFHIALRQVKVPIKTLETD